MIFDKGGSALVAPWLVVSGLPPAKSLTLTIGIVVSIATFRFTKRWVA